MSGLSSESKYKLELLESKQSSNLGEKTQRKFTSSSRPGKHERGETKESREEEKEKEREVKIKDDHFLNIPQDEGIDRMAAGILSDIDGLSNILSEISKKERADFAKVFASFMDNIKKELKNKLDKIVNIFQTKLNKNANEILEAKMNLFRNEAIRLNNFCNKLKSQVSELSNKMNLMTLEMTGITMKWKSSENMNQKLMAEFEKEIKTQKEMEDELFILRDELKRETEEKNLNQNMNDKANIYQTEKENALALIEKLRFDLKREKNKCQRFEWELNRMKVEKNKLENIFIDCIEVTRKNVLNRRIRESIRGKKSTNMKMFRSSSTKLFQNKVPDLNYGLVNLDYNTKFDTFLPSDKEEILEKFLFNDEVSKVLRNCLFVNPQKEQRLVDAKNHLINKLVGKEEALLYSTKNVTSTRENDELNLFLTKSQRGKFKFPKLNESGKFDKLDKTYFNKT